MKIPARMALILGMVMASAAISHADEWVDRANQKAGLVPGNKAIEAVLFPAVAAMSEPPVEERGLYALAVERSSLLSPDDPQWDLLAAWAQEASQVKVLEELERIGDPKQRWMLALPFGRDAVDSTWAEAGLCITLGGESMLAGADYTYLDVLGNVHLLVTVEANRLLAEGKGDAGLEHYADLMWLYRYMADRQTAIEKHAAMELMIQLGGQMRDLAYRGLRAKAMTGKGIADVVAAMEERELYVMRIRPPELTRTIVEQLVERTLGGEGGIDGFSVAMARATTAERPLMLFNESAKWRDVASEHASARDTLQQLDLVLGDYSTRWTFPFWDPLLTLPTDFQKMDHRKYAAIVALAGETGQLMPLRQALVAELSGTRCALAGAGYQLDREQPARDIVTLQPNYVPSLKQNLDPYKYNKWEKALDELLYFVPGTGQRVEIAGRPGVWDIALPAGAGGQGGDPRDAIMHAVMEQLEAYLKASGADQDEVEQVRAMIEDPMKMLDDLESELDGPQGDLIRKDFEERGWLTADGKLDRDKVREEMGLSAYEAVLEEGGTTIEVDRNNFVLYSVGVDGVDNQGRLYDSDLIFWPPLFSMLREKGMQ